MWTKIPMRWANLYWQNVFIVFEDLKYLKKWKIHILNLWMILFISRVGIKWYDFYLREGLRGFCYSYFDGSYWHIWDGLAKSWPYGLVIWRCFWKLHVGRWWQNDKNIILTHCGLVTHSCAIKFIHNRFPSFDGAFVSTAFIINIE